MLAITFLLSAAAAVQAAWSDSSLEKHVDSLDLVSGFVPVIGNEFTGAPHHHRTPFAVSPDGKSAYIAYLEGNRYLSPPKLSVHVQKLSAGDLSADGEAVTIEGAQEASGLVAHDDGFALLTHMNMTQDDPEEYWIPTVVRYKGNEQAWSAPVGGKTVIFQMFPDTSFRANKGSLDGDLAFGENGTYAAFFRAEYYAGTAEGHGGDSIVYLDDAGSLIPGPYSQTQHCGHNFGIALSTSKEIPFASVCTADDGFLTIATNGGEQPTIGEQRPPEMFAAEALGGTRGSYSNLARIGSTESYLLAWVNRPAGGDTDENKAKPRYVEVAQLKSKDTLGDGPNDITQFKPDTDCFNAHVAAFDESTALVTWEESSVSGCDASGCSTSTYTGTRFQLVDASGSAQGESFASEDVFVSGDIAKIGSKLCWPYVNMKWDSSKDAVDQYGPFPEDPWQKSVDTPITTVKKMSFACVAADGSAAGNSTAEHTPAASPNASVAASTVAKSSSTGVSEALPPASTVVVNNEESTTPSVSSPSSNAEEQTPVPVTSGVQASTTRRPCPSSFTTIYR